MNLKSLIGKPFKEAKRDVYCEGLDVYAYFKRDFMALSTLPDNVVMLVYDENDLVTRAETQESIEAKYL